jgi:hypothetical protein
MTDVDDPVVAEALRAQLRSRRFRIWLALDVVLTIGLLRLPLFGVLGFELAFVLAAFGSLAGLDLGAALVRRAQAQPVVNLARAGRRGQLVVGLAVRALVAPLALIALPALAAAVHGLWAPTCDWGFGVTAVVVLAAASAALGAGSGVALALLIGRRRFVAAAAPWLAALALLAHALWRFYAAPPVFSYSALVGFFPGNLYDEDIRLAAPLYWARLEQVATVMAALGLAAALLDAPSLQASLRGRRPRPIGRGALAIAVVGAALASGLRVQAGRLGYSVDAGDLQAALGGERRTEHFVIHYADRADLAADIDVIAADHELRLAQVCATLGVDPDDVGVIHSYLFASDEQKGRLMGARRVEMAKPWRREIYLSHEGFPHPSLRHEIAHVVAGTFGDPWFSVSAGRVLGMPLLVNPGLIEGLAVAADWPGSSRTMTPHQATRALELLGWAPPADALLSLRFLSLSSARSYTTAGSFVRWLLDVHGAAAVRRLYATGGDFEAAFGVDQATLLAGWRQMLSTIEVPAEVLETARDRFRGGSVFSRPCPHAVAARVARAARKAAEGDRAGAVALMRRVCRDAPDPAYSMGLAGLLAAGDDDEQAEARLLYETAATGSHGMATAAVALEALTRAAMRAHDPVAARARLDAALAFPLDDDRRRPFEAMARALDDTTLAGSFLRGYFFAASGDRASWAALAVLAAPHERFGWYLLGLQLDEHELYGPAARLLRHAIAGRLPSPRFVRAGARRALVAAWRAGDVETLTAIAAVLDGTGYEVDRWLADDWRQRARLTTPP